MDKEGQIRIYSKFSINELACRCGRCGFGQQNMNPTFMKDLMILRIETDITMDVTSAIRCPSHNARVSSTGIDGPHTPHIVDDFGISGNAVDINIWGKDLVIILEAIYDLKLPFSGKGFNQRGEYSKRFLHLDNLPNSPCFPRPWIWTY